MFFVGAISSDRNRFDILCKMASCEYLGLQTCRAKRQENSDYHRLRINTEEKAYVVTAVWGTEFIQFLARYSCFALGRFKEKDELHIDVVKKRMNCTRMIRRQGGISPRWFEDKDELHEDDMKTRMNWRKGWISPGWFEDKVKLHEDDLKTRMYYTRMIWKIGWIHHILKSLWCKRRSAARIIVRQTGETSFAFSAVVILLLWRRHLVFFYDVILTGTPRVEPPPWWRPAGGATPVWWSSYYRSASGWVWKTIF